MRPSMVRALNEHDCQSILIVSSLETKNPKRPTAASRTTKAPSNTIAPKGNSVKANPKQTEWYEGTEWPVVEFADGVRAMLGPAQFTSETTGGIVQATRFQVSLALLSRICNLMNVTIDSSYPRLGSDGMDIFACGLMNHTKAGKGSQIAGSDIGTCEGRPSPYVRAGTRYDRLGAYNSRFTADLLFHSICCSIALHFYSWTRGLQLRPQSGNGTPSVRTSYLVGNRTDWSIQRQDVVERVGHTWT